MGTQGTVVVMNVGSGPEVIRITGDSIFNGPYPIEDDSIQNEVDNYLDWLREQYIKRTPVYKAMLELASKVNAGEDVSLLCDCEATPSRCNVLKYAIERVALYEDQKAKRGRRRCKITIA